jgi:hypothetical protein
LQRTDKGAFVDFSFFLGANSPPEEEVEDFSFFLVAFARSLACADILIAFYWPWQGIQNMMLDFCAAGFFFQRILISFVKSLTDITKSRST